MSTMLEDMDRRNEDYRRLLHSSLSVAEEKDLRKRQQKKLKLEEKLTKKTGKKVRIE